MGLGGELGRGGCGAGFRAGGFARGVVRVFGFFLAGFVGGGGVFGGLFATTAGKGFHGAGFVDDAREFVDDAGAGEFGGIFDIDEGDAGAFEEFFHIFGAGAGSFVRFGFFVFELDGANGAEGALITKDEVDGFVLDEAVGGAAVLEANFVAEEGRKGDAGDDIETLAEEVV